MYWLLLHFQSAANIACMSLQMNLAPVYFTQEGSQLYQALRNMLNHNFTEPYGYPDVPEFRIVKMYTRAFLTNMKVLCSFSKINSWLRLVITITAFGIGAYCPDILKIIHYIPVLNGTYLQETGRAGRDGRRKQDWLLKKTLFEYYLCCTDGSTAFSCLFWCVHVCVLGFMFVG